MVDQRYLVLHNVVETLFSLDSENPVGLCRIATVGTRTGDRSVACLDWDCSILQDRTGHETRSSRCSGRKSNSLTHSLTRQFFPRTHAYMYIRRKMCLLVAGTIIIDYWYRFSYKKKNGSRLPLSRRPRSRTERVDGQRTARPRVEVSTCIHACAHTRPSARIDARTCLRARVAQHAHTRTHTHVRPRAAAGNRTRKPSPLSWMRFKSEGRTRCSPRTLTPSQGESRKILAGRTGELGSLGAWGVLVFWCRRYAV